MSLKKRVFSLVGISGALLLCFVILSVAGYTQDEDLDSATAQDMIKRAFPNSRITWSKELKGEMVNFKATSSALAIMIGNGDKRRIDFVNFEDTSEWSIDCDDKTCRYYDVFRENEPRLLIWGLKHSDLVTRALDAKGAEILDVTLDWWLSFSPTGRYYYPSSNFESSKQLEIYDHEGRFVWKGGKGYEDYEWLACALTDSELIYKEIIGCYLLDAFTGETIWNIPSRHYTQYVPGFTHVATAKNGKYFAPFCGRGLVSISREGKILWRKWISQALHTAGMSEDGRFIAVYFLEGGGKGKKLALMDNLKEGEIIWSRTIEAEGVEGTSNVGGIEIAGNIVKLIPGIVYYRVTNGITENMHTYYFEFDLKDGRLLNQYRIDGVCETFRTDSRRIHYLLVHKGDKKEIFRFEQTLDE